MKTKYKAKQLIKTDTETIEILKVYPKGNPQANENSNFYLIDSSYSGQDVISEQHLSELITMIKAIKH